MDDERFLTRIRELQAELEDLARGSRWALEQARAAESREKKLREALEAVIDYVPPGFISPMDDEDSMNYRAIARAALAEETLNLRNSPL